MRIACPLSSGCRLTSATIEPPLLRIGSISIGFMESNTSHTVSARRNNAAGVVAAKENVRLRPSLLRLASTRVARSPATLAGGGLVSAGGSDAATVVFGDIAAAGAGIAFDGCSGAGVSGAGEIFGAASGLISIFACLAIASDVGGTISPDCCDAGAAPAGFSDAAGAAATGAADAGAADAGACEASDALDGSAGGFSACWKA